ncbi:hypothetical protein QO010_000543 [Caulobacter ginsengisoli]|uniref:Uncharacterized protein n=1 Tax=Caulobacter ginsengisoli TaxID=400775 RepID=A0ABU0IMZ5_9CAUL|nr:hypothetical protein [Caulobacter ginsengisoli]MDQ0462795.1 hypothetical protein [Caulobacter ginsengisoli]
MPQRPNGLSLVLELVKPADQAKAATALAAAFSPPSDGAVNILHYAWVVFPPVGADGRQTALLSTVYDESFEDYIGDLVNALPDGFNAAADLFVGMGELKPIQNNIPAFTQYLLERDLTKGGTSYFGAFFRAYPYTVDQIQGAMQKPPPPSAAQLKKARK